MAHTSRIAGFPAHPDHEAVHRAAEFWGAGFEAELPAIAAQGVYLRRCPAQGEWRTEARSPQAPCAQIDIETDDLEAEAARLEDLGARRIGHRRQQWWMLELPAGQRIRVAAAADTHRAGDAQRWG